MLRRIRLRETERLETSSEPDFTYSSLSIFPRLTSEAIRDILRTGKITNKPSSASMSKMTSRNTPASAPADQPAHLLCPGQGHRKRHRNDRGADDLVELPAKAVLPAICGNHRLGERHQACRGSEGNSW